MNIQMLRSVVACFGVTAMLVVDPALAAKPTAAPAGRIVKPFWTPLGVGHQTVTMVLQLAGDPVAVQQAQAGRKLERAEKDQIKNQLRRSQGDLDGLIQGLGGRVIGRYQSAYNGIKVRVPVDQVANLSNMPGVIAVRPVWPIKPNNVHGIPAIGAPAVWQNLGLHGEGVKVAIIDTGIDYTHANFGGPGTAAAYAAAFAADTAPANPALFGPNAPRVKGGIDLVGDDYDADPNNSTYQPVPHPDPNPLDCGGHGSHVAGTAAGGGVRADGSAYKGPYNASTVSGNAWKVGPGVAPKADLYAVRVFGCAGSTDVVVDAIDWAVDNDMDVINLSLGSPFGTKDSPDAQAATNAAKSGVIVVVSAGNEGPNPYITGSPASADGAIAVAASDPTATFPGAKLALNTAGNPVLAVQNSNGAAFVDGTNYQVVVLRTASGAVSLGCDPAEYAAAGVAGKLVVTQRGVCARVARAVYAQQAGAVAAALIDTSTGYPPFEGPITLNPDTGQSYTVTIPFFGVRGLAANNASDGGLLRLANGGTTTASNAPLPNPNYLALASFSSGGPRTGDSTLKPNLTAPGVNIVSTSNGTGNGAETLSGTSMAAPHVTGVAALARQAHPRWQVPDLMASIVNTASPAQVQGYRIRRAGTGLVQAVNSTVDQVTARVGEDEAFDTSLNFGLAETYRDFNQRKWVTLRNHGATAASFSVSQARPSGSPHTVSLDRSSVTVPARGSAVVGVTLAVPVATAGASNGSGLSFNEVAGLVQFTPVSAQDNGGIALNVPYYLVPRPLSGLSTTVGPVSLRTPYTTATITNPNGAIAGDADFYSWGLYGSRDPGRASNDIRAVGTQSFPFDDVNQLLVFAINTFDRWSNASNNELDIDVDVDGDGVDDYVVAGVDEGAVTTGVFNGRMAAFVFSTRSAGATYNFYATAPTDSSTALLPVLTSQLCRPGEPCLSAASPRISYHAIAFDLVNGGTDVVPGIAKFNVWSSALSQGGFATVAPRGSDSSVAIAVNPSEWAVTPARGLMIVTLDNKSGPDEAQLIDVRLRR